MELRLTPAQRLMRVTHLKPHIPTRSMPAASALAELLLLFTMAAVARCSPLHDASTAGNVIMLKELLGSGKYDVNEQDEHGKTPLLTTMTACTTLNKTAPCPQEPHTCSPAAQSGIVAQLVCAGADVSLDVCPSSLPGYKLLHLAACGGAAGLTYLLSSQLNPDTPFHLLDSSKTVTPLTWAVMCLAECYGSSTAAGPGPDCGDPGSSIYLLLQSGANPLPDGAEHPLTALLYPKPFALSRCNTLGACTTQEVEQAVQAAVQDDVSSGNASSLPEDFKHVMLHWQQLWEAQEQKYANPNAEPQLGDWMKLGRQEYACKAAQEYYDAAMKQQQFEQAELQYAVKYPLHAAVANNNLTAVKQILDSGEAGVNDKDGQGLTPLQKGMQRHPHADAWSPGGPQVGDEVAAYLVAQGADVQLNVYPDYSPGYTLLHKAAMHGYTKLVKILLSGGADPNAVTKPKDAIEQPSTPLMAAADCYQRSSMMNAPGPESANTTIQALLDAGANPLLFGKDKPLTATFHTPPEAEKCTKVGACSEPEVLSVLKYFTRDMCPASFLVAWRAQEKMVAAGSNSSRAGGT